MHFHGVLSLRDNTDGTPGEVGLSAPEVSRGCGWPWPAETLPGLSPPVAAHRPPSLPSHPSSFLSPAEPPFLAFTPLPHLCPLWLQGPLIASVLPGSIGAGGGAPGVWPPGEEHFVLFPSLSVVLFTGFVFVHD